MAELTSDAFRTVGQRDAIPNDSVVEVDGDIQIRA